MARCLPCRPAGSSARAPAPRATDAGLAARAAPPLLCPPSPLLCVCVCVCVPQFYYGEDGIDPMQTGCLKTFPFLFYNSPQVGAGGAAVAVAVAVAAWLCVYGCGMGVSLATAVEPLPRPAPSRHSALPALPCLAPPNRATSLPARSFRCNWRRRRRWASRGWRGSARRRRRRATRCGAAPRC